MMCVVAIETFTKDIVRRAKDVEVLIAALPEKDDSGGRVSIVQSIWREIAADVGVGKKIGRTAGGDGSRQYGLQGSFGSSW